ncbi:septum site-determining protein DivIVA [Peptoclostridium acidaminophilum DSM 3953]|uniref:Septum site-determining protein DivIVA n=1 Tax=Peptoclostridium acidaminophilum DSM 3953 TaxID=1286171 RepID=W8TKQ9_PEPAC|nr:DivIVA domain-containing protein [Peptoclostridium acidaminophilum]AHM56782.1 septum site-determining protein DivIVA [Peptoclostridium acidaminophilum DSM 3953]
MITPLDIENKEFKRGLRGYKEDEVDDFLDEIKEDFEKIYKENIELRDKINMLSDQISKYKGIEETLKNTLVVAQSTAEEVSVNASKKAQIIVEDSELRARKIIEEANNQVIHIMKEYEQVRKEFKLFKSRFKSMLGEQIKTIDEIFEEMPDSSAE